ncbi:hypothetical protein Xph01_48080 [Micromonospora phaseoli]|nr:hypothetical protein Xph01_48080 [Micromonospora phaseoli]
MGHSGDGTVVARRALLMYAGNRGVDEILRVLAGVRHIGSVLGLSSGISGARGRRGGQATLAGFVRDRHGLVQDHV